jgi:hypothetical protein
MSKHTPGPWVFDNLGCISAETRDPVATVDAPVDFDDLKEIHANARLIAAAPDLLAACKAISAAPYGVALGDLETLNAAIVKAEGEPCPPN